ncbi:MAG: hypothetical protein Alpg2KO_17110 [Alphaproteobacteria bacterium]
MSFPQGSVEARFAPLFEQKVDAENFMQKAPRGFAKGLRTRAMDESLPVEARSEAAQTLLACFRHAVAHQSDSLHSRYAIIGQKRERLVQRKAMAEALEEQFKDLSVEVWRSPLAARAAWLDLCHREGARKAAQIVSKDGSKLGPLLGRSRAMIPNAARREAQSKLESAIEAGRSFFLGSLLQGRIERDDRKLAAEQAHGDYTRMRATEDKLGPVSGADVMDYGNLVGQLLATQAQDWAVQRETRPLEAFTIAWRKANATPANGAGLMDAAQTRWFMEAQSLAKVIDQDETLRAAAERAGRSSAIDHCLDPANVEMPINLSLKGAGLTGPGRGPGGGIIKP